MEAGAYVEMDAIEARHWWFRGKRRLLAPLIERMLGSIGRMPESIGRMPENHATRTVLEIGCGTGGNLAHFAPRFQGVRFVGLDFDQAACAFARDKCAPDGTDRTTSTALLRGDGLVLPIADNALDGALALDIIEHFDDDLALCRELLRALKPGADLVLSVPAWPSLWSPHDEFLHHKRRYRPAELRTLIEAAGFEVQETRGFNFLLLPPIWLVRRLKAKQQGAAPASGTDFFNLPGPLEALLAGLFVLEAALVRILPIRWGVSIMMRARKPRA